MIVGFTGGRNAPTHVEQNLAFRRIVRYLGHTGLYSAFHHGQCKGADEFAHRMIAGVGGLPHVRSPRKWEIVVHAPHDKSQTFELGGESVPVTVLPSLGYLDRNHAIVDASDIMIAMPDKAETLRSGTWATVRYARETGTPVYILHREGNVTLEMPDGTFQV